MDNCVIVCSQALEGIPGEVAGLLPDAFGVAVDGGLSHFKMLGITPELWVGDCDSLSEAELKQFKGTKAKLPKSKDYTDLEFALHLAGQAYLEGHWEGSVILLGAQGGRFDHELGNIIAAQSWLIDMAQAVGREGCPGVTSFGPLGSWFGTVNEAEVYVEKGQMFSVMGLGTPPKLSISGAKYTIKDKAFSHSTTGLSNEGIGKPMRVYVADDSPSPAFVFFPAMPSEPAPKKPKAKSKAKSK